MGTKTATRIWIALSALLLAMVSARYAIRRKEQIGASPILGVALVLWSAPALFELERGQANVIPMALLVVAGALLKDPQPTSRLVLAGALAGIAAWTKLYPAIVVLGLLFLSRRVALVSMVATCVAVPLVTWKSTWNWASVGISDNHWSRLVQILGPIGVPLPEAWKAQASPAAATFGFSHFGHSLTSFWPHSMSGWGFDGLAAIPGLVVSLLLLVPLALFVAWSLRDSASAGELVGPLLLWLAALGTFVMPGTFDYSLVFLPPVLLAVWDRRDPLWIGGLAVLSALAYQPIALDRFLPRLLGWTASLEAAFALKLLGLVLVGILLCRRAREGRPSDLRVPGLSTGTD